MPIFVERAAIGPARGGQPVDPNGAYARNTRASS